MRLYELLLLEDQPQTYYHGTLAANVPDIMKHGLRPSSAADASAGRWATLGGVYLSQSFDYAVKAATHAAADEAIAVIAVRLASTKHATPDEDVIEKVLVKAFTSTLDMFGVDDAYNMDLEQYANDEENRPDEYEPFNRDDFFRDFWAAVMQQMSKLAGVPRKNDLALIRHAVELAIDVSDHNDIWSERRWRDWQAVKAELVKLYPRLRNAEQHAKAGITLPHNIRIAKPIPPRQIVSIVKQTPSGWVTIFSHKT